MARGQIDGLSRSDPGESRRRGLPRVAAGGLHLAFAFAEPQSRYDLFDVETAFFYPWALIMDTLGVYGLAVMGGFFFVLGVGFVYEWKVGAMDW